MVEKKRLMHGCNNISHSSIDRLAQTAVCRGVGQKKKIDSIAASLRPWYANAMATERETLLGRNRSARRRNLSPHPNNKAATAASALNNTTTTTRRELQTKENESFFLLPFFYLSSLQSSASLLLSSSSFLVCPWPWCSINEISCSNWPSVNACYFVIARCCTPDPIISRGYHYTRPVINRRTLP